MIVFGRDLYGSNTSLIGEISNASIDTTLSPTDQATTIMKENQPRTITTSSSTLSTSRQIQPRMQISEIRGRLFF